MGQPFDMAALRSLLTNHLRDAAMLAELRGAPLSPHRRRLLEGVAGCGDPHEGFVWLRCHDCDVDRAVALSCKARVACPRCGGRRMASIGAHLVDDVLPAKNLRQWVVTFPQPLPRLLAWRPDLLQRMLAEVAAVVQRDLQHRTGQPTGRTGIVSFVQTFTGDLRLFVHVHALVLDGVYVDEAGGLRFVEAPIPTQQDIEAVAERLAVRIARACKAWRAKLEPTTDDYAVEALEHLARLGEERVGAITPRPKKADRPAARHRRWMGSHLGLEIHAGVSVPGEDGVGRERLVRYAARSAISLQRLELEEDGRVFIRFKRPWRNGTQGVRLTPEVFVLRLASLLFPPRTNLTRYHGVFAPASPLRTRVVPDRPPLPKKRSRWIAWGTLIFRVFGRVADACPECGRAMQRVATLHGAGRAWDALRWIERRHSNARDGPG